MVTLTLSLLAAPLPAEAQPRRKIPLVGMLLSGSPPGSSGAARGTDFFRPGLRDLGYVEGQDIALEDRYADHQFDRLPALAAELVRLTPEVIWTHSNAAALAAKRALTPIPVVMGVSQELMALGVVENLARPGGNVTGLDLRVVALMGTRLELLQDAVPTLARVAVLVHPTEPLAKEVPHTIAREARALGVQLQRVEASGPEPCAGAFAAMIQGGADAVMLPEGPPFGAHMPRLLELAPRPRLPTMCSGVHYAEAGCLLTDGAAADDLCPRSAVVVDKMLNGATPAHRPVESGDKFSLSVNLKTAEALGLTLPPTCLPGADEVIK